jgi:hypothetical protein
MINSEKPSVYGTLGGIVLIDVELCLIGLASNIRQPPQPRSSSPAGTAAAKRSSPESAPLEIMAEVLVVEAKRSYHSSGTLMSINM